MANGMVVTNSGRKLILNRGFKVTPDYLAPTHFKVGTGTTTPTVSQTDLVAPVAITGVTLTKDFVAGYPSLDETNFLATIRCLLLTTEPTAQPVSLAEFGLFNEDGTPLMFSRIVHTAITKNTSTQIIYIEKNKLT